MSAARILWPAVTATPFKVNVPAEGNVVMMTAFSVPFSPAASTKPKSSALKVLAVSSRVSTVLSVAVGALFGAGVGVGVGAGVGGASVGVVSFTPFTVTTMSCVVPSAL